MKKARLLVPGILILLLLLFLGMQAYFSTVTAHGPNTGIVGHLPGSAQAVAVQDDYAYVAFKSSFAVVDVSDKTKPVQVGQVDMGTTIHDIAIAGAYAYVGQDTSLSVLDVSTPSKPEIVRSYPRPLVYKVLLSQNRIFALSKDGLEIFDIATAPDLLLTGSYEAEVANPHDLDLTTQYAFILDGHPNDQLSVVDITDLTKPRLAHTWGPTFLAWAVAISGDRLLDIDGTCHSDDCHSWLNVLKWNSETWDLSFIGSHETSFSAYSHSIEAKRSLAYVGKDIGLFVFDIYQDGVHGAPPHEIAVYDIPDVKDMALYDGYLFTAGTDGLTIVEEYPQLMSFLPVVSGS